MSGRPRLRGRISFASVPADDPRSQPLSRALIAVSNAALITWVYPCWGTARIRWDPSLEGLARLIQSTSRPLIYYSWHAYEPTSLCAFRDAPPELMPTAIGHDGLLSRMLQQATARLGYRVWVYRRGSPVPPRQQIIEMVRDRGCNIGLFADAGGPYGCVKPGLPEIGRATDAWLVPLVVRGRPTITFRRPWHYVFPLPFCRLTANTGEPIDGREATIAQCQEALDHVERGAR